MTTFIKSLKLCCFRNYESLELNQLERTVVLLGENGSGKTNLLESISLLAKGRGIRNANIEDIQNSNNPSPWSVHYKLQSHKEEFNIRMIKMLKSQRALFINDKSQSNYNMLSKIVSVIWLIPEIDHIFLKSLSERLKFFDRIVNAFHDEHSLYLLQYNKVKYERSQLLKKSCFDSNWVSSLENILALNGLKICIERAKTLKILKKIIDNNSIIRSFPKINITLKSQVSELANIDNHKAALEIYCLKLKNDRKNDMLTNRLNYGIHNDKLQITNLQKNISINYCSTGEQKIVLALIILATIIGKNKKDNSYPILLLDDIMSHLDETHRNVLLEAVLEIGCQTCITDVNETNFLKYKSNLSFFYIKNH